MGDMLDTVAAHINERATAYCQSSKGPGYLAGVYHAGRSVVAAQGTANVVTGALMSADTGFLFGSVTKVLTTTLVLQQVERGNLRLDDLVVQFLPDLKLMAPAVADQIVVQNLLNHTNGIDADLFFPNARGPDALKVFVDGLEEHCGALFGPGEFISYSNGGMIVAGRLLEVVTGVAYHDLLKSEIYAPAGMDDSSTSAEDAILRSTAVGHFPDPATGDARRTGMFMLPDSWGPAGSSPIGTVNDLLRFASTYLAGGLSPSGNRVLSSESAELMRSVTHDMESPNIPPVGLGWLLMPFGDTIVLSHSGASPGGVALLAVVPEHDLAFAAFGNDPRAMVLHDEILLWLLREHLKVFVPPLLTTATPVTDLARYAGTYRSNQLRVEVSVADGELEEKVTYEPIDEDQSRIFTAFVGGTVTGPPRRLTPVHADLFAPAGMPLDAFTGYSRQLLVSYHRPSGGQPALRSAGGRMTRRSAS